MPKEGKKNTKDIKREKERERAGQGGREEGGGRNAKVSPDGHHDRYGTCASERASAVKVQREREKESNITEYIYQRESLTGQTVRVAKGSEAAGRG